MFSDLKRRMKWGIQILVKKILNEQNNPKKENDTEEDLTYLYNDIEEKLKYKLGSKTTIKSKSKGKGKIEIEYFGNEDLD